MYYITLDSWFTRIFSHHFFLLNHFRYGIKISIPLYLYTSLNSSINGIRENVVTNPPLHDGLMLLIYEYIKVFSICKSTEEKGVS